MSSRMRIAELNDRRVWEVGQGAQGRPGGCVSVCARASAKALVLNLKVYLLECEGET